MYHKGNATIFKLINIHLFLFNSRVMISNTKEVNEFAYMIYINNKQLIL